MGLIRLKGALVLVLLEVLCGAVTCLQKYGVQDSCGKIIEIGATWRGKSSSGILVPRMYFPYQENSVCSVIIKSSGFASTSGMVVSVRKLDLRPNRVDTLVIRFDNHKGYHEVKLQNIFPYRNTLYREDFTDEYKSYVSSSDVTIIFSAGSSVFSTGLYDGFQLTLTATSRTPCSSYEFKCATSFVCIAEELRCDGHNHCGDLSDQFNCGPSERTTPGTIVGSIFGTIFLVIALISCCVIIKKRRYRRGVTTTVITNPAATTHEPPPSFIEPPPPYLQYPVHTVHPSYPPSYEQTAASTAAAFK